MTTQATSTRRQFIGSAAAAALAVGIARKAVAAPAGRVQVFKTPTCGCCEIWVEHLTSSGFAVETEDLDDLTAVKQMAGVPDHLLACHTGMIEGYTVEGHVPAAAIEKLLAERPDIKGLAVPGMPAGSPGMPAPEPERYDVIAFGGGAEEVFMRFIETDPI